MGSKASLPSRIETRKLAKPQGYGLSHSGPHEEIFVQEILTISDYLRTFSNEIGEQVVSRFPPLHQPGDPVSPHLKRLKRRPFPGQELAVMGIVKAWEKQASAMALAECVEPAKR
jgi:hypothetical protein